MKLKFMNNIGLIGLGVMGQNLVLNMNDHGYSVSVFNRTLDITKTFCSQNIEKNIEGYEDLNSFILSLEKPRKIILLVKAGDIVDDVINQLKPLLESGDIIIDSGNSFYKDTQRREQSLAIDKIRFIGLGISGGEEGARNGPSFMAGGDEVAYAELEPILKNISALDFSSGKCVSYFGKGGAGHYVKMVHNGIEYIDMQLIADIYNLLKNSNKNNDQILKFFKEANESEVESYLIEITIKILSKKDEDGKLLLDSILDYASQKGTGQWASVSSLEIGYPGFSFASAVFSRYASSQKDNRVKFSNIYNSNLNCLSIVPQSLLKSYYIAKIISYAQGLDLIKKASEINGWNINMSECVRVWQGGCIIRARLLKLLLKVYEQNKNIDNILESKDISVIINNGINDLRTLSAEAIKNGIVATGFTSSLEYFENLITKSLPSNLIAAQRDVFGAHGYKRIDEEGDFHTNW